jgi:hypothetical protein
MLKSLIKRLRDPDSSENTQNTFNHVNLSHFSFAFFYFAHQSVMSVANFSFSTSLPSKQKQRWSNLLKMNSIIGIRQLF